MSQPYFLLVHLGHLVTYKGITILLQEVKHPSETAEIYLHTTDAVTSKSNILEYNYAENPSPYMLEYQVSEGSKNVAIFYDLPTKILVPQVELLFSVWEPI